MGGRPAGRPQDAERLFLFLFSESFWKTGFAHAAFRLRPRTQRRSLGPKTHERGSGWTGHCDPAVRIYSSKCLPGSIFQ